MSTTANERCKKLMIEQIDIQVQVHVEVLVVIIKRKMTEGIKVIEIITVIQNIAISKPTTVFKTVQSSKRIMGLIGLTMIVIAVQKKLVIRFMKVEIISEKEILKSLVIQIMTDTQRIKIITKTDVMS